MYHIPYDAIQAAIELFTDEPSLEYRLWRVCALRVAAAVLANQAVCDVGTAQTHRHTVGTGTAHSQTHSGYHTDSQIHSGYHHSHWSNSRVTSPIAIFSRTASATWPVEV